MQKFKGTGARQNRFRDLFAAEYLTSELKNLIFMYKCARNIEFEAPVYTEPIFGEDCYS
jgi:hypothetical protein